MEDAKLAFYRKILLSADVCARIEAKMAEFRAYFVPKVELARNAGPKKQVELLCELIAACYDAFASEFVEKFEDIDSFRAFLLVELPGLVVSYVSEIPMISQQLLEELEQGAIFVRLGHRPWLSLPVEEIESAWHVGAYAGETLSHGALEWEADYLRRVAELKAIQDEVDTPLSPAERQGDVERFIAQASQFAGEKIPMHAIATAAGYTDRSQFEKWKSGARNSPSVSRAVARILAGNPEQFAQDYMSKWKKKK